MESDNQNKIEEIKVTEPIIEVIDVDQQNEKVQDQERPKPVGESTEEKQEENKLVLEDKPVYAENNLNTMQSDPKQEHSNEQNNTDMATKENKPDQTDNQVKEPEPAQIEEDKFNKDELAIAIRPNTERQFEEGQNKVYAYGSAECDQFYINEEVFESRRPVEIPYFSQNPVKIIKISCGAQHTAILTQEGKVLTWGNSDSGALGREVADESTVPGYVQLDYPVDIISSGECHTICANSLLGVYIFWGTVKSTLTGKLFNHNLPETSLNYRFQRNGIHDIKSGYNHIVLLSKTKVYTWGDNDAGALGTVFRNKEGREKSNEPVCTSVKNSKRIFVGGNHTFVINKQNKVYGFGLNNYGQLGLPNTEEQTKYELPEIIPGLNGKWIENIIGGEHHTLIVMKNGWVFGAGRNDDGQLGQLSETVKIGGFRKLTHLPVVSEVKASNHFNYAETSGKDNYYSWGLGFSYVLANGKEDTLEEARQVNNDKFFKQGYPSELQIGHSHIVFTVNKKGDKSKLASELIKFKEKFRPIRRKKDTKKMR